MKFKFFGQHGAISHPRRAKERQKYISSSLASSAELSDRLLSSLNNDPSRALAMKFRRQWLHPACPVQKWYQQQQQVRSSTKFTRIEHWTTNQPPFFHEYLLIHMGDQGTDVCQVERLGDGTRGAGKAISREGCRAYDIIQWLPTSDAASNLSAKMISRIDFPRSFDLIDVLAICWSIQGAERCSVYTLQRYNCYFLCLTILAVLARRVGAWEKVVESKYSWPTLVGDVIGYLEQTECENANEYIALELPKLLDPDHPSPRKFVLDPLQNHLIAEGLNGWKVATSVTLWAKDIESAVQESLGELVKSAAKESLDSEDTCATQMKHLLDSVIEDKTPEKLVHNGISLEFAQVLGRSLCEGAVAALASMMKSQILVHSMREIERQPALWCRAVSWAGAPLAYVGALLFLLVVPAKDLEFAIVKSSILRVTTSKPSISLSAYRLLLLALLDKKNLPYDDEKLWTELNLQVTPIVQKILQSSICPSRETKFQAMQIMHGDEDWVRSLQYCLSGAIGRVTETRIAASESSSEDYLLRMTNSDGQVQELPPTQFHEDYVRDRIRKHAERVGSMGLAAAPLMEIDIYRVMGDVWKQLPDGYGGSSSVDEMTVDWYEGLSTSDEMTG